MRCTSRRTASLMPISLARARDTVLTETPRRSAMSDWFARFCTAMGRPRFVSTQYLRFLSCARGYPFYPRLLIETFGQPGHLRPFLKRLAALVIVELVFFHALVGPAIGVECTIDSRGRAGFVHHRHREQGGGARLPGKVHAIEIAERFKDSCLLVPVLRQEADDLEIGIAAGLLHRARIVAEKGNIAHDRLDARIDARYRQRDSAALAATADCHSPGIDKILRHQHI